MIDDARHCVPPAAQGSDASFRCEQTDARWTVARWLQLATAVLLALAMTGACDEHAGQAEGDEHGHAHEEGGHDDHGHGAAGHDDHGHGHGEAGHDDHGHGGAGHDDHGDGRATEVVTRWGESTQLFVEFPALVVGEESAFAVHFTRLTDHAPIATGSAVIELSGGGHPDAIFSVGEPSQAGIFRPVVTPKRPGKRSVRIRLNSPMASEVHELGELTVYGSADEARATLGDHHPPDDAISFLLEQQWNVPFRVEEAVAREMRPNVPAFARLRMPSDAEAIVTAPRDGRIAAIGGRFPLVGEDVEEGTPLFALGVAPTDDADPAKLDLAIEQARIQVGAAKREVERLRPLVEKGVVARRRLDAAESALATARAELRSARRRKSAVGQSQKVDGTGNAFQVPSPIEGAVAEIFVAPGTWVSEGQRLARIVDRDRLWLDVAVPEAYVGRIKDISGAWFELDNYEGVFELSREALVSVGTEVDPQTRTLPVRFRIDNVRRELFAGMSTQAHLVASAPQRTVAVPYDAVIDDDGVDVVFVQHGGETFERRPVKLGIRDGRWVEALDGVAPGEWVVTRGAYTVKLAASSTESVGHGHAH